MTILERPVRRTVKAPRRDLVVSLSLEAGEAVLSIREKGRRAGYSIPIPALFTVLALRNADNLRAAKKAARRKGKV